MPIRLELSHTAEGYHAEGCMRGYKGEAWRPGNKVELSNLETQECNESRKSCSLTGAMWRRPDGSWIPQSEMNTYRGPTQCPHASFGLPCYAPYPIGEDKPSFKTPFRGKRGRGGDGDGPNPFAKAKVEVIDFDQDV